MITNKRKTRIYILRNKKEIKKGDMYNPTHPKWISRTSMTSHHRKRLFQTKSTISIHIVFGKNILK